MVVEYERTIEDFIEFNLYHISHSPSMRRQILIGRGMGAFLVFLLLLGASYLFDRRLTVLAYITALFTSTITFFLFPLFHHMETVRALRKAASEGDNRAVLGRQIISLSSDGISAQTQAGESRLNWSSIDRVAQSDKSIFLYISSTSALMIPKKAFSTAQTLQEFLDYVEAHREQKNKGDQATAA
jgi:hypothetical protein